MSRRLVISLIAAAFCDCQSDAMQESQAQSEEQSMEVLGDAFREPGIDLACDDGRIVVTSHERVVYVAIRSGEWRIESVIEDSDTEPYMATFGHSVSLRGSWLAIGRPEIGKGKGQVVLYESTGDEWIERQRVKPADAISSKVYYGASVSLGTTELLVGSPRDDSVVNEGGMVEVFELDVSNHAWKSTQTLRPPRSQDGSEYGFLVVQSGKHAVDAAPGWRNNGGTKGVVFAYSRSKGGRWELSQVIEPATGQQDDRYASTLAMDGGLLLVGVPYYTDGGIPGSGAVEAYRMTTAGWTLETLITSPRPTRYGTFGTSIATDREGSLVIGAPIRTAVREREDVTRHPSPGYLYPAGVNQFTNPIALGPKLGTSFAGLGWGVGIAGSRVYAMSSFRDDRLLALKFDDQSSEYVLDADIDLSVASRREN